jgi:hypothetical protein
MRTGDKVNWCGSVFSILAEYDDEYIYLAVADGAQLVHRDEVTPA